MSELNGATVETVNRIKGKVSRKVKPATQASKRPMVSVSQYRKPITIILGCGIPGASLFLSARAGVMLEAGSVVLGSASLLLCGVILAVSLSHLSGAIEDITGSSKWQSWAMALSVDASLILCELATVHGHGGFAVVAFMIAVTVISALLNVWAFLRHK